MKKLFITSFLFSFIGMNAQDGTDAIKSKIADLTSQKAAIESQIADLNTKLPVPVKPNWTYKGNLALNLGQNLLSSDWMKSYGGNSTLNLGGVGHLEANYQKGRHEWKNNFDGLMGFFKNINVDSGVNDAINKNADMLQINSKYLYDLQKNNLKIGMGMNFLSQFTKTYKLDNSSYLLSDFLAPGVLDLSPGIQWTPSKYFNVFFAPASGRMNFVTNDTLIQSTAAERRFGNDLNQKVRSELGAKAILSFEKEIIKNLTYRSTAQLFNNWSRPSAQLTAINSSRSNIDINWQNDFFYKVSKNIALNFGFQVMKDDDVRIKDAAGVLSSPWNWRNSIGVGFVAGF